MKYSLEKKVTSKKLMVGLSILFCVVILIIGTTTAFFTQSNSETTGNIVSIDKVTLKYLDNKNYMRNNLIPAVEVDVPKFAMKNSLNDDKYTDDDICKYKDNMYACSLYEFTIENTIDVAQSLAISMSPTLNQYNNLYFILYEGKANELNENSKVVEYNRKIEQDTINFDNLNLVLKRNESKTYTIVFYVKNLDYVQDDAGKRFAASISVNSITTGYNVSTEVGEGCYESVKLDDGTYKLTRFNGINHQTGDIVEGCGVTQDGDYYSVTVPSTYGGHSISTLGNTLFYPGDLDTLQHNRFLYIKEVKINEGISILEDGLLINVEGIEFNNGKLSVGTFSGIGYNIFDNVPLIEEGVNIILPNSLEYIGDYSFTGVYMNEIILPNKLKVIGDGVFERTFLNHITLPNKLEYIGNTAFARLDLHSINIPSSVKIIGDQAFYGCEDLTKLTIMNAEDIPSKLGEIGESAFWNCNLTYVKSKGEELIIPSSVYQIGSNAFGGNESSSSGGNLNLEVIRYMGTRQQLELLGNDWYRSHVIALAKGEPIPE